MNYLKLYQHILRNCFAAHPSIKTIILFLWLSPVNIFSEPANFKSGISVLFSGTQGRDWQEEVFWHKPTEDSFKVVYIRSSTKISMIHNERNVRQGNDQYMFIGTSGGGTIRYYIDRDWQLKYNWGEISGGGEVRYPRYITPFSFSELTYGTGFVDDNSDVPVVGSVGDNRTNLSDPWNRSVNYHYGQLDEFGDEWHTLTYADDDTDIDKMAGIMYNEVFASDGGLILFVVNPKTPCIVFSTVANGQYYTTPPKLYQVPKVHSQITYISDDVNISIFNIQTDEACYYKWDNAETYTLYTGPFSCNNLSNGSHTIYYYYDPTQIKTRSVIKNPPFPSSTERHGYMFWENDIRFSLIKTLIQTPGTVHKERYDADRSRICYPINYDALFGKGERNVYKIAAFNALVAKVQGYNNLTRTKATVPNSGKDCAERAKKALLDNATAIPDLGRLNGGSGMPNPCKEIRDRGYYDVDLYWSQLFAYDTLIHEFKSTDYPGGITPIEDYKIRDSLARFVIEGLGECGLYGSADFLGMWSTSRQIGALAIAMCLQSYNNPYYGTSGFDGTKIGRTYTPYPTHAITWKQILYDEQYPTDNIGFPNWARRIGLHEMFLDKETLRADGQLLPIGSWKNRIAYSGICGYDYRILANLIKISPLTHNKEYPVMAKFFEHANAGTLYALQLSGDLPNPVHISQLTLINERFPELAEGAEKYIKTLPNGISSNLYIEGIWGLVFYNPNWRDTTPVIAINTFENRLTIYETIAYDLFGNPISFSPAVPGLPIRANFSSTTNMLSWRPWYDQAGSYELLFSSVSNDYTQKVTINVEDKTLRDFYQDFLERARAQQAMMEY